jgi:hypothetical protein
MPGGEVITGAPEDVIANGAIAQAFEGRQIRFHAEERAFRWLTGERGRARIDGQGLRASMARAVLEREGFAVVADQPSAVTIDVDDARWRLSADGTTATGETFRSLAAELRRLAPDEGRRTNDEKYQHDTR